MKFGAIITVFAELKQDQNKDLSNDCRKDKELQKKTKRVPSVSEERKL